MLVAGGTREGIVTSRFAWEGKYREALLELGPEELQPRIDAARRAIEQRLEELGRTRENCGDEQRAIDDAMRVLRVLAKTECQVRSPVEPVMTRIESAS